MKRTDWGTQLQQARHAAGLSISDIARRAGVSRSTVTRAEDDTTDTGIATYEQLAGVCKATLRLEHAAPKQHVDAPPPPSEYPNPRSDDPWDNDAVQWLLTHDGVLQGGWTRQMLLECLRRQPHRVRHQPRRVREALALANFFGVEPIKMRDPRLGKTIVRLRRTDDDAPAYPYPPND